MGLEASARRDAAHSRHRDRPLRGEALRARNRRVGLMLAAAVIVFTALCMAYIYWFGGTNKPPMKPFHSGTIVSIDAHTA